MRQIQVAARQIVHPRHSHGGSDRHTDADHHDEHCSDAVCDHDADHDCRSGCGDHEHEEHMQAAGSEMILPAARIDAVGSPTFVAVDVPSSRLQADASCCGGTSAPIHSVIDVPLMEKPASVTLSMIAFAVFVDAFFLPSSDIGAGYKIGASPPFLASTTQHTYLRTSVLLI